MAGSHTNEDENLGERGARRGIVVELDAMDLSAELVLARH